MSSLDKHSSVPVELALQLEGVAINHGISTQKMLERLLAPHLKKELTEGQKAVKALHEEGLTGTEIARKLGRTQQSVSRSLLSMGITPNKKSARL